MIVIPGVSNIFVIPGLTWNLCWLVDSGFRRNDK